MRSRQRSNERQRTCRPEDLLDLAVDLTEMGREADVEAGVVLRLGRTLVSLGRKAKVDPSAVSSDLSERGGESLVEWRLLLGVRSIGGDKATG